MAKHIRWGGVLGVVAAAMLWSCTDEPVACLIDSDCPEGQYCRSLECMAPSGEGDVYDVYRERVMPLVESGCNCHGPDQGRPWYYDHADPSDDGLGQSLSQLRNWAYNPRRAFDERPPAGVDRALAIDQYALIGYATAQCGFNHPQIWEPGSPQVAELQQWLDRAYDVIERPAPLAEAPQGEPGGALPPAEEALARAAEAAGDVFAGSAVADRELERRLIGQCGCCHVPPRFFALPSLSTPAGEDPKPDLCGAVAWLPRSMNYGLGLGQHPIVYTDADEPRYALLHRWFGFAAARGVAADARCQDEAAPMPEPDVGVDMAVGDGGVPDAEPGEEMKWQETVAAFRADVEPQLGNCSCHFMATPPSLTAPGDDEALRGFLRGISRARSGRVADPAPMFDVANPAASRFITTLGPGSPIGEHNAFPWGNRGAVEAWISGMPAELEVR